MRALLGGRLLVSARAETARPRSDAESEPSVGAVLGSYPPERLQFETADDVPADIREILMQLSPAELAHEASLFLAAHDADEQHAAGTGTLARSDD